MVDVALVVGGVLMIFAIVPLASSLARRAVRARTPSLATGELRELRPDLVRDLAVGATREASVLAVHEDEGDVRSTLVVDA